MSAFIESMLSAITTGGSVRNKPVLQQDLIDNAKNGYPDKSFRFVFGKRTLIQNTMVDLWEGSTNTYIFPTGPMQMKVVSTNANDTALGTGARSVRVDWLDDQFGYHVDDIVLNGTTPVSFPFSNMYRINYMHVRELGSTQQGATGDITITNPEGNVVYSIIKAGFATARQAIGTVPAGFYAYINHWQASSGSTGGNHFTQITLKTDSIQGTRYPGVFLVVDEVGTQDGGQEIDFPIPTRIPEKTDIKLSAISDAGNANVTCLGAIMGWFEAI